MSLGEGEDEEKSPGNSMELTPMENQDKNTEKPMPTSPAKTNKTGIKM